MLKLRIVVLVLSFVIAQSALGQNERLGIVTDLSGAPLAGVTIQLIGGPVMGVTNGDGEFQIEAGVGQLLEFQLEGFANTSIEIGESNIVDILLQAEEDIGNLVVTHPHPVLDGFEVPHVEVPGVVQGAPSVVAPNSLATIFPYHLFLTASAQDPQTFNAEPLLQTIAFNDSAFAFSTWPGGAIVAVDLADFNVYATGAVFGEEVVQFGPLEEIYQFLELPDSVLAQGDSEFETDWPILETDSPILYRASRITPKPSVSGVQTAIVEEEYTEVTDESETKRYSETFHFDGQTQETFWIEVSRYQRDQAGRFLTRIEKDVEVSVDGIVVEEYTETRVPDRPILVTPGEKVKENQVFFAGGTNIVVTRDETFPEARQTQENVYSPPVISLITKVGLDIDGV